MAASGATFFVGFTVNEVHQDLVALYWQRGQGMKNEAEQMKARAIFYDIAEAEHQTPKLSLHWSDAWAQTYNKKKNPAVVGTIGRKRPLALTYNAGASSSSAGTTPASGGNLASTQPLALTDKAGAVIERLLLSQVVPPPGLHANSSSCPADSQRASGGNDGSRPLRLQSTTTCNPSGPPVPPPPPLKPPLGEEGGEQGAEEEKDEKERPERGRRQAKSPPPRTRARSQSQRARSPPTEPEWPGADDDEDANSSEDDEDADRRRRRVPPASGGEDGSAVFPNNGDEGSPVQRAELASLKL